MKAYFDIDNVKAIIRGKSCNPEEFYSFVRYAKRYLDIQYNFSKEEFKNEEKVKEWFLAIGSDGVQTQNYFCPDSIVFPTRPIKGNAFNTANKEQLTSVYLLNIPPEKAEYIQQKRPVLLFNIGEEKKFIDCLENLLDYPGKLKHNLSSWRDYCPKLPITDIILDDGYYFSNKNTYGDEYDILSALAYNSGTMLNIVIVAKKGQVPASVNLQEEVNNIKAKLCNASGLSRGNCKVTIVLSYRTHDRYAITNYYTINSGNGFILDGKKSNVEVKVDSLKKTYDNNIRELLEFYEDIAKHAEEIYGDRKSNLIKFT